METTKNSALNLSLALVLVFLTTTITTIPKANAQFGVNIGGINVNTLNISGQVSCSPTPLTATGLNLVAPPLANVTVALRLNNTTIANVTTNVGGVFNFPINLLNTGITNANLPTLRLALTLPVGQCGVLANVGVPGSLLQFPLGLVSVLTSGIANFIPGLPLIN